MKYDSSKKMRLGAKRILLQLNNALIDLLIQKDFDDITIQELCEHSMISKSSFYNYFDDKYDLLRYFFQSCKNVITQTTDNTYTADAFPRLLDAAEQYRDVIRKILQHNKANGTFQLELLVYFNQVFERLAKASPKAQSGDIPIEIRSKVNTYMFLTVFEWAYTQNRTASREEVVSYISKLYK